MFAGQFEPDAASLGDNFNMTHPMFLHVAKMNNFRRLYPALQTGWHVNKWNTPGGPGLFAYESETAMSANLRLGELEAAIGWSNWTRVSA